MTERRLPGRVRSGPADEGPRRTEPAQAGARTPGRFPRPLACCLAVLSLSGCSATADGSASPALLGAGAAAAVVLAGGSAFVARRATARPLKRERDQATRNLGALLEERAGLAAEREAQDHRLQACDTERQALLQEREQLLRQQDELTEQWTEAAGQQTQAAARLAELSGERDALVLARDELTRERDELEGSVDSTFVNLAMRTLTLVERQLVLIEALEGREADPAQLESLFRLDHLATRMRRNSENMLLLAGLENSHRSRKTVTLLDVVRAAVSEIERYERVQLGFLAAVRLGGAVADDTSHLVAELLENATAFSPPQDQVEVGGWLLDNGELMISVVDRGIGLPAERLRALNEQLSEPVEPVADRRDALLARAMTGRSMGLFVVARLARRHGIRVQLRENAHGGGVTAMVVLPREALQQDAVTTTDLDDQRRAERSVTSAAETVRAAAEATVAAQPARPVPPRVIPPVTPAAGAAGTGTPASDADLPPLPRRKPAQREEQEQAAQRTQQTQPEQAAQPARSAQQEPQEPQEPQEDSRAAEGPRATTRTPEQSGADRPGWEDEGLPTADDAAAPGIGPVTPLGLPRRIPRGSGLPGTGELPASGLRRLATEPDAAPRRSVPGPPADGLPDTAQSAAPHPGTGQPDTAQPGAGQGGTGQPGTGQARLSPEELRRRLGVFQGGLRRAGRSNGSSSPAHGEPTAEQGHSATDQPTAPAVPAEQPHSAAVEGDKR